MLLRNCQPFLLALAAVVIGCSAPAEPLQIPSPTAIGVAEPLDPRVTLEVQQDQSKPPGSLIFSIKIRNVSLVPISLPEGGSIFSVFQVDMIHNAKIVPLTELGKRAWSQGWSFGPTHLSDLKPGEQQIIPLDLTGIFDTTARGRYRLGVSMAIPWGTTGDRKIARAPPLEFDIGGK
jgi:hypothetical protein